MKNTLHALFCHRLKRFDGRNECGNISDGYQKKNEENNTILTLGMHKMPHELPNRFNSRVIAEL